MPLDEFEDFFNVKIDIDTRNSDEDSEDDNSASSSCYQWPSSNPPSTSANFPPLPLNRIVGSVFTLDGPPQRVPFAHEDFDHLTTQTGVPIVNKNLALEALAQFLDDADRLTPILVRRPRGFGLRTFTSMWSARLDVAQATAADPFVPLAIGAKGVKLSPSTLHRFHILHLDLANVEGLTDDPLREYLYARILEVIELYQLPLVLPDFTEFRNFPPSEMIFHLAAKMNGKLGQLGGKRLYVIIDNCESSNEKFSGQLPEFYMELQCAVWIKLIAGVLYTAYMDDSASDYYAGRDPDSPVDPLPFDAPPSLDLTHHPVLQSAIGFTQQDIEDLDSAMQDMALPGARPLLDLVHERSGRPLLFSRPWTDKWKCDLFSKVKRKHRLPDVPVYSASAVLDALGQKCGCPNRIVG